MTLPLPETTAPDLDGLRVLAFCDYFGTPSSGGSERVAAELYRRMAGWGAEITVVAAVPGGTLRRATAEPFEGRERLTVVRVPATDLSPALGVQLAVAGGLPVATRRAATALRPHVLHAHNLYFQGSVVAAAHHRLRGVPLVTTVHTAAHDRLSPPVRLATGIYGASVGRFILGGSDAVIAVGGVVADHLRRQGVPVGRLHLAENGVDHDRFHPPAAPPPARAVPEIAFVGRLIALKGAATLLDALALLHADGIAFRCTLVGDGPLRAALEHRARDAGLPPGLVRFTGYVDDVPERLRAADVFVLPSFTEGRPLALLEAMASGCCVVAADIPAVAVLVDDGRDGLRFPAGDAAALATRLRTVLTDPATRARLAAAGRTTSLAWTWEAAAAATARVLTAVRDRAARRSPSPATAPILQRQAPAARPVDPRNRP